MLKLRYLVPASVLGLATASFAADTGGLSIGTIIALGAIFLFLLVFAIAGFKVVKQAEVMVIERLGKYAKTLKSGLHLIIPIIDKPRRVLWTRNVNIRGRTYTQR